LVAVTVLASFRFALLQLDDEEEEIARKERLQKAQDARRSR
jgi:hypothetical protein